LSYPLLQAATDATLNQKNTIFHRNIFSLVVIATTFPTHPRLAPRLHGVTKCGTTHNIMHQPGTEIRRKINALMHL